MKVLFVNKDGREFYREMDKEERRKAFVTLNERVALRDVAKDPLALLNLRKYRRVVEAGHLSFIEIG